MSAATPAAVPGLTRRRLLGIVAAVSTVPAGVAALRAAAPSPAFHRWTGEAMGALATLALWHPREDVARRAIARVLGEVARLEAVFSLHDRNSQLSRLNRDGRLDRPAADLVAVLEASLRLGALTAGAFDPTVQPLWDLYSAHYRRPGADPAGPAPAQVAAAAALADYRALDVSAAAVRFAVGGMGVTLNGIAQGFITDRVADLLRNEGFDHVEVDLGEIRTIGRHPDGRDWVVGLGGGRTLAMGEGALAVSGGYGLTFDPAGRDNHIFDPRTGRSPAGLAEAVVLAPRATVADALSTAILVAGETAIPALLAAHAGTRALLTRADGTTAALG